MRKKASLSLVRNINYDLIWEYLAEHGKSTIPCISAKVGLSLPTVTRAIDFGVDKGMISIAEMAESARGRKAQLYMMNPEFTYFLLILLDNNGLHYEVRNLTCEVIESDVLETAYDEVLQGMEEVFARCIKKYPKISSAAIAFTGVTHKGVILD